MAQHFLLSAKARTLSLKSIYAGGEAKAYETFCKLRWPETDGEPICPRCGCIEAYKITTRRRFKCAACSHQYSVTSGTILHSRKMTFLDLLAAVCIIVNAAKGLSALQLSRDLDCQHKTAFVLAHKIREALASETSGMKLVGDVEVDGAYFGGVIRQENRKEDRKDRRLAEHQTGKRRVVVALRQRKGRTLPFVFRSEDQAIETIRSRVLAGSMVFADEASSCARRGVEGGSPPSRQRHAGASRYRPCDGSRRVAAVEGLLAAGSITYGSKRQMVARYSFDS